MRLHLHLRVAAAFVLVLSATASAVDGVCTAAFCQCPDGRLVEVSCGTGDCIAACGGSSSGYSSGGGGGGYSGPSPITIMLQETSQAMRDAHHVEANAWDAEVAEKKPKAPKWRAQEGCSIAMDAAFHGAEDFKKEADDFSMQFIVDDYKATLKKLKKSEKSAASYKDAYDALKTWAGEVKQWSSDLSDIVACVNSKDCRLEDVLKKVNADIRKWFQEHSNAADAAKRVEKASKFLEDYAKKIQASNDQNMRLAAHCLAQ